MTTKAMYLECPCCGAPQFLTTGVGHDHPPKEGDLTVMACCGAICEFDEDLAAKLLEGPAPASTLRIQRRVRIMRGLPVSEA